MERIIKTLAILTVLLLAFSTSALALSVADVGAFDLFKAADNIDNNDTAEKAWIASQFGYDPADITFTKWEPGTWTQTDDDTSAYYFDFGTDEPFAFLIKGGSTNSLTYVPASATGSHILYENIDSKRYGLIDFDLLLGPNSNPFTIETISHTSAGFGDDTGEEEVPEPSTLALLGLGLVGLAVYRRKKN